MTILIMSQKRILIIDVNNYVRKVKCGMSFIKMIGIQFLIFIQKLSAIWHEKNICLPYYKKYHLKSKPIFKEILQLDKPY